MHVYGFVYMRASAHGYEKRGEIPWNWNYAWLWTTWCGCWHLYSDPLQYVPLTTLSHLSRPNFSSFNHCFGDLWGITSMYLNWKSLEMRLDGRGRAFQSRPWGWGGQWVSRETARLPPSILPQKEDFVPMGTHCCFTLTRVCVWKRMNIFGVLPHFRPFLTFPSLFIPFLLTPVLSSSVL